MVLSQIGTWCCEILYKTCPLSLQKTYLKSVYKTICLFQTLICGNYTEIKTAVHLQSCQVSHFADFIFRNITSVYCNVTNLKIFDRSEDKNKCSILDVFGVAVNKAIEATSLEMLPVLMPERCNLNWCVVSDYTNFWWKRVIRQWYELTGTPHTPPSLLYPEKYEIIQSGKWSKDLVFKFIKSNEFKSLAFCACIAGGGFYAFRKYLLSKKKDGDSSRNLNMKEVDVTQLEQLLEKLANNFEKKTHESIVSLKEEIRNQIRTIQEDNLSNTGRLQHKMVELQQENAECKTGIKKLERTHRSEVEVFKNQLCEFQRKIAEMYDIISDIQRLRNEAIQHNSTSNLETRAAQEIQVRSQDSVVHHDPFVVNSLKKIETIFKNTEELEKQVVSFIGRKEDKAFLHLKEMLIRNALNLDNVESEGNFDIRRERKKALQYVHLCLKDLEDKVVQ